MCTHLVSALMLGEMLCQKWAKTLKDYDFCEFSLLVDIFLWASNIVFLEYINF